MNNDDIRLIFCGISFGLGFWFRHIRLQTKKKPPSFGSLLKKTSYQKTPLLNKSEVVIFKRLQSFFTNTDYYALSQVGMGECIKITNVKSFNSNDEKVKRRLFESKRIDFVIVDKNTLLPVCFIEYQGTGHYQGNALDRDQTKKAISEKAGIPLLALPSNILRNGKLENKAIFKVFFEKHGIKYNPERLT